MMSARRILESTASVALAVLALLNVFVSAASAAEEPRKAVLTVDEVVQILDETVDWYRTLGAQQQTANQPSDLLILYANHQTADKVMDLAFDFARANAELLSSEADSAKNDGGAASPANALNQMQNKVAEQRLAIQTEMEANRRLLSTAAKKDKALLQEQIAELQGELDLVNARHNLLETMADFTGENDTRGARASALKVQIDAIARSIPSLNAAPALASGATLASASSVASGRLGIWDLASNVIGFSRKINTIDAINQRTAALQAVFTDIRSAPLEKLKAFSARGDILAAQADGATGTALRGVRDQFDTLAWLFKQTSSILIPLNKEIVLLGQYRHNLNNWHAALQTQYREALKALGIRVGILAALLAFVFAAAAMWRRAVFHYVHEPRRRFQLLLARKIAIWAVVVAIVGSTFASEFGSLVTFAGLLTAGLAVAMQSILVSIVGYFFLIGKYGIRVGDRVQIGSVSGEVIELGLVRLHLMELNDHGSMGPTGRVVAFANSIVFQASGGLFKQIPGVNIAWHEITLKLPSDCDSAQMKVKLLEAVTGVIQEYSVEIERQTKQIQKTTASSSGGDAHPQVQLHFSISAVEALVRYPVQLQHAAEIDERVSRALLNVISGVANSLPRGA